MKFCKECGSPLNPDSKFCKKCGVKITKLNHKASESVNQRIDSLKEPSSKHNQFISDGQANSTSQNEINTNTHKIKAPRSNINKNIWLYLLAVVMITMGTIYFFNKNADGDFKAVQTSSSSSQSATKFEESMSESSSIFEFSSSVQADSEENKKESVNEEMIKTFDSVQVSSIVENAYTPGMGTYSAYVSRIGNDSEIVFNEQPQRAASTIKIFIMLTAYSKAKANELDLSSTHRLYEDEKVGGTGIIRDMPGGSELTLRELVRLMIVESDNTAANIMIDELGGFESINEMINKMGCYNTTLNRKMMDTAALESGVDNYTSVKDLGIIMKKLYMNTLISEEYDNEMLGILSNNTDHSKLPYSVPAEADIFNKTGTYSTYGVENDVAIISNENGAFVVAVMTQDGQDVEQITAMNSLGLNLYEHILN